jgi:ubiquinone/menaquinone biosynthesis C-methylase UbiE
VDVALNAAHGDAELGAYFDRCANEGLMAAFGLDETARLARFEAEWAIKPGDRVLEPGCGSGRLTERLAAAVGPAGLVLALDLSEAMVERARQRGLPRQVRLRCASVEVVPSPDAGFDHVICLNVLPHLARPAKVLAELHRVLAPGGHLWVNHFACRDEVNAFHANLEAPVREHRIPPLPELERLLQAAGFQVAAASDAASGFRLHGVRS